MTVTYSLTWPISQSAFKCEQLLPPFSTWDSGIAGIQVLQSTCDIRRNWGYSIFPNPASTEIFIRRNAAEIKLNAALRVELTDIYGRLVLQKEIQGEQPISVVTLQSGLYFCQILETGQPVVSEKIMVVR